MSFKMDASEVIGELKRLQKQRYKAGQALDAILGEAFVEAEAAVHILTGSLKNSGDVSSEFTGDKWHGEIAFGGASHGAPKDPVVYAFYEWRRGGSHDWFAGIENDEFDKKYGDSVVYYYFRG
jgi:hypothetical protein